MIAREPGRPGLVHVQASLEGESRREQSRPRPGAGPRLPRERESDTTNLAGAHGTERRINRPKGSGAGSRSALTVPSRTGNRVHRDPAEGSEASHGWNRRREARRDTALALRVNATVPDSRTGSANPPCEQPDALMRARPALWGEGLGNDPSCPAPDRPSGDRSEGESDVIGPDCRCLRQENPAAGPSEDFGRLHAARPKRALVPVPSFGRGSVAVASPPPPSHAHVPAHEGIQGPPPTEPTARRAPKRGRRNSACSPDGRRSEV